MYKYISAIVCFLSLRVWGEESHKVVFLVSPPRSLSVGFTRMIQERGDFKIFLEPAMSVYFHNHNFSHEGFLEDSFKTFDEVKKAIFEEGENVFIKEMSAALVEVIDEEVMKRPDVYFVFLLRDPHPSIISFYSKLNRIVGNFHEATGYKATYDLFQKIAMSSVREPLILYTEELASKPKEVVEEFCEYVGIPFKEEALTWDLLGENFNLQTEWKDAKKEHLIKHWHGEALQSRGFSPLKSYEIDDQGTPTFSEVQDPKDREECQKAYELSLPYYQFFRSIHQAAPAIKNLAASSG